MSEFSEFWSEKTRIDDRARESGKPAAALTDVFPALETVLDRWDVMPEEQKQSESGGLSDEQRQFLLNAARGMSILAVRVNRTEYLRYGLLALLLEGARSDSQETVSYLSLLNHSAAKIGANLMAFFSALDARSFGNVGALIERFLSKSESAKAISLFGFQEVQRSSGFDYKRSL
jgi:hypothetical protein